MTEQSAARPHVIALRGPNKTLGDITAKPADQRTNFLIRLLTANVNSISDGELLELVLSCAPAPTDANALAIRLLEKFGSVNRVVHADIASLSSIEGVDDAVLKALAVMRLLAQRMIKSDIAEAPVIQSWSALMKYCQVTAGYKSIETFRVLFLNNRHMLIADEEMQRGTVNHTPVYPREIVKRALELCASSIILFHNHPSGDYTPSPADISITKKIVEAAAAVNIAVHDHVIVTESGHYSFKSFGLMGDAPTPPSATVSWLQYELF